MPLLLLPLMLSCSTVGSVAAAGGVGCPVVAAGAESAGSAGGGGAVAAVAACAWVAGAACPV